MITSTIRVIACFLSGFLFIYHAVADESYTLQLSVGEQACKDVVLETKIPPALAKHHHFDFIDIDTGKRIPVQVDRNGSEPTLVWIVRDEMAAGTVRRYRVTPDAASHEMERVTVTDEGKSLLVKIGNKPVLNYNYATVPSPDPKQPYYARSGYIHPLYNPSGDVITDDFNPDHAHQHGIMMAWRKMTFEGRHTNGWDQKSELGKIEHVKLEGFGGGPVFGYFKARLHHIDLTAPGKPKTALDETWYVRIYNFEDAFQFDITSTQKCATSKPVSIDLYHYGGMTIRGRADWHKDGNFDFLTDEGKTKVDGNHSRPRWVDLHGPVAGQTTGTLIMDHKSNFRFPQPVRLPPKMPYFCFTPATIDTFTISPGTAYVSRFRFYVHNGALKMKLANQLWNQYCNGPEVRISKTIE